MTRELPITSAAGKLYFLSVEGRIERKIGHFSDNPVDLTKKMNEVFRENADLEAITHAQYLEKIIETVMEIVEVGKTHRLLRERAAGERKPSLGYKCLEELVLPAAKRHVDEMMKPKKGGEKRVTYTLPGPRQFKRLCDLYLESGCDAYALIPRRRGHRRRQMHNPP